MGLHQPISRLAVFTAIYPAALPFLGPWARSVEAQTDRAFDLWISLDEIDEASASRAFGRSLDACWISAPAGSTIAGVRQIALEQIAVQYDAVIFVDSDDVMGPDRVRSARLALSETDLTACALGLIDREGVDLARKFCVAEGDCSRVLPRHNIFGLSNSAFRTDVLRRCLPIPDVVELVDWYLATRAWLCGARMSFDRTEHMLYRQHGSNIASVIGPFSQDRVTQDSRRVLHHFRQVVKRPPSGMISHRFADVQKVADDVERFVDHVVANADRLADYSAALNKLTPEPVWWWTVAQPKLRSHWTTGKV